MLVGRLTEEPAAQEMANRDRRQGGAPGTRAASWEARRLLLPSRRTFGYFRMNRGAVSSITTMRSWSGRNLCKRRPIFFFSALRSVVFSPCRFAAPRSGCSFAENRRPQVGCD